MRLRLEATAEELVTKRERLVRALVSQFQELAPDLAEVLEKALPAKEQVLKYPALQQLKQKTTKAYQQQVQQMLAEIGKVLDGGRVQKSEPEVYLEDLRKAAKQKKLTKAEAAYTKVEGSLYACNECEHWIPGSPAGEEPNLCAAHKAGEGQFAPNGRCEAWKKGEPVPGREPAGKLTKAESFYRENEYHTGFRCNRCRYWVEGGKCEKVAGDIELEATCKLWEVIYNVPVPLTKALPAGGPFIGPRGGKWADPQHTIPWKPKAQTPLAQLLAKTKRRGQGQGREVSLSRRELDLVLSTGKFALVSAGPNPRLPEDAKMTEGDKKARHEKLRARLKQDGYAYTQVVGDYGEVEDSFLVMVHDAQRADVRKLGQEFKQDSVIYGEAGKHELHYTLGPKAEQNRCAEGVGHAIVPDAESFFTLVQHPDGTSTKFSLNLNLDEEDEVECRKALLAPLAGEALFKALLRKQEEEGEEEGEPEEPLEPGDVDPETGEVVPYEEEEPEEEEEEGEEIEKAGPFIGPKGGKWADPQHTIPWRQSIGRKGPRTGVLPIEEAKIQGMVRAIVGDQQQNKQGVIPGELKPVVIKRQLKDPTGKTIRVKVSFEPGKVDDLRGVKGRAQNAVVVNEETGQSELREVLVTLNASQHSGWDADDLGRLLRDVLSHEVTHALDPSIRKKGEGLSSAELYAKQAKAGAGNENKSYDEYLNLPREVTASIQQIYRDITTKEVVNSLRESAKNHTQNRDFPPPMSPSELLKYYSSRWAVVGEHYSTKNRKRVLKMAAAVRGAILEGDIEGIEKSLSSIDPAIDHTQRIAQKDDIAYQRVREVLKRKGYVDADFDNKTGALYGWSVNELIDLARDKRMS